MIFPRYPEYKETGIEWLGQIPAHWDSSPLWSLFNRQKSTGFAEEELLSVYRDYGVIQKSSRDDNFNKASEDLSTYQLVVPGDLVINKMKAWQGSLGISPFRGIVSPAYFVYSSRTAHHGPFLHYLLRSTRYSTAHMVCSKGIRINQWDLDPDQYRTLSVVLPPLDEQGKVAAFLDHETAKIDALVAEQEQLIALLKEKRQAVISHAVTKGLNPDAPMKDSGIEWIGAIPATWRTSRLKFEISMLVDCPHETPTYSVDGEFSVVRTADVADGALLCEGMLRIAANDYEHRIRRSALEQDDIVYGREGERWGHAALIPAANQFCLGQRMIQLRANTSSLLPEFLMWQLSSTSVYRQGALDTVGSTSPHVNLSTIRNFWIAVPPIDVQRRLIDELRTKIAEVRTLIAEAERGIELLQERRTALISAAVTGQIDVRGWADRSVA